MAKLEEITATFIRERFRFENIDGDTIIGDIQLVNGSREKARDPNAELAGFFDEGDSTLAVKGKADFDELQSHQTYSFRGRWVPYKNNRNGVTENQFHFVDFYHKLPHSRAGIITYLQQAGKGNGIGQAYAARLWDAFGSDAVRVLRETPAEAVRAVPRFTIEQAESAAEWLRERQALEDVKIELSTLLDGRGIPKRTVADIVRDHGNRSVAWLTRDPHAIMDYRGVGWKKADVLYTALGRPAAKMRRQALLAWYTVAADNDGHTWYPANFAVQGIRRNVDKEKARPIPALKLAKKIGQMNLDRNGALSIARTGESGEIVGQGGSVWLAESRKAWCEERLAECVVNALDETGKRAYTIFDTSTWTEEEIPTFARCKRCNRKLTARAVFVHEGDPFGPDCIQKITKNPAPAIYLATWLESHPVVVEHSQTLPIGVKEYSLERLWPDIDSLRKIDPRITDHQLGELRKSTASTIGLLGGSPGCGKTFIAAILIKALCETIGRDNILVGAPTGKAAVRLTELMTEYDVPLRARTWHSILGMASGKGGGSWKFAHNENNPLDCKVIIGDESSMLDTSIASAIFAARAAGCHVLLIGDVNQLPPVGHGAPLRDLIAAGLSYGELREIKRNSGGIVEACASIRDGERWSEGDNLKIFEHATPEFQLKRTLQLIEHSRDQGLDPIWDCQVLVAVNKKSELSRTAVNELLQDELNPNPKIKDSPFRLADKIVNLKNGFFPTVEVDRSDDETQTNDAGDVYVANGELAEVIEVQPKLIVAKLAKPYRVIKIPRGKASESDNDNDSGSSGSGDGDNSDKTTTGCSWDLGYALSVHKFQGSEVPVAIILIDEYPGARMVCSREWTYTAISRAKTLCALVGRKSTADRFCKKVAIGKRKTLLRELILKKQAERVLVDL